jgi:ABC-2 type transport system permease protein
MTLHHRWWLALMQLGAVTGPAVSLLVWDGARRAGADLPVSGEFLTTYLLLVSVVALLTSSWTTQHLSASIRLGGLSSWLVRPCSTHLAQLANNLGEKLVKAVVLVPLLALLAVPFRDELRLPGSVGRWACFAVATVLAASAGVTCVDVRSARWPSGSRTPRGWDRLRALGTRVLSGAVLPLAMFPTCTQASWRCSRSASWCPSRSRCCCWRTGPAWPAASPCSRVLAAVVLS